MFTKNAMLANIDEMFCFRNPGATKSYRSTDSVWNNDIKAHVSADKEYTQELLN